jgi:hypothetical protein
MALETPRFFHAGFDLSRIGALRWRGAPLETGCSIRARFEACYRASPIVRCYGSPTANRK